MLKRQPWEETLDGLKERIRHLEEEERWHRAALDIAASMVRLHAGLLVQPDANTILWEAHHALERLIHLQGSSFFMVNDADSGFELADCHPDEHRQKMVDLVESLIESGDFAWAIQQNNPVVVRAHALEGAVLLHVLSTRTGVQGMYVGILAEDDSRLSGPCLNLISLLLHNCAYALENHALQHQLLSTNRQLEERIDLALTQLRANNHELLTTVASLQQKEEALQAAHQTAEAANQAKSRFLATMSHEIRTPMNAILGMAQMLAETPLSPQQAHYVTIFQRSGENLLTLINDILDLSKIESAQVELETTAFDLRALVEEAVQIFSLRAHEKGVRLISAVARDVPYRQKGDPNRLRQILVNLIGNAIKFTHRGRILVRLEIDSDHDRFLRFTVSDTGIGIPADKLDHVFAEFTQVDSSTTRRYGGTGLGLAICQRLVHRMGGDVWVKSEISKGSDFNFTLPIIEPEEKGEISAPVLSTNHFPTGESNKPRQILLVEDSEDNAILVRLFLRKLKHVITTAENGLDGVNKFQQGSYDLLLMDMQMPVMDGFEATRTIRRWEQETGRSPVPIIALTAYAFPEDRRKCLEAGCDDYLSKPLRKEEFLAALQRLTVVSQKSESPPIIHAPAPVEKNSPE